jgi:DNA-binding GntR family transcriptional regulator
MAKRGDAKSLSADVYARMRESIFNGGLRPGDRLQPAVLSERYNASTTVIREALALLAGERLVQSRVGHGFFIPEIKRDELRDLTLVRCDVESMALRLAMERGGVEWESELIASHHRLSRAPRRTSDNPDHPNQDWAKAHREFHEQLIGACAVPMLMDICAQLGSATELYRVWAGPLAHNPDRDVEAEHVAILDAVLAGETARAVSLLTEHFQRTANMILENWPEDSGVFPVA